MDLHLLSDDERRALCRRELDGLELWLRRLIHEAFSAVNSADYLNAVDESGRRHIKKSVADDIAKRRTEEPDRYHRTVDAARLGDLVIIICNPENWRRYFGDALNEAFPIGKEEARAFLNRLVDVRNKLSHANPISIHEAARVLCYTLDVIEALKGHYMKQNLETEYNVPTIIRITDSFGNVFDVSGKRRASSLTQFNATSLASIRPGERLSLEVDVDPSFDRSSYRIRWKWPGTISSGERITIEIANKHVRQRFAVTCEVISNKDWHKLGERDDWVLINYKILPPVE